MPGITSKLPEGWERSETNTGIPYYINHENEITQWDHPEMVSLMEEIDVSSKIKYAAYRTAVKLRAIQKKTQLYMVTLSVIIQSLDEEGIRDGFVEGNLSVAELLRVITTIFTNQNRNSANNVDVSRGSELVLNWLLNVYDPGRTGFVQILSVKVGLSVLCTAKVQDKYRYMFKQLCIGQKYLDRRKLKLFLQEMLEIPKFIYESAAFSGSSVEPAVRNCFERVSIPEGVSAEEFIEWMTAEPQTIVWLPTLHRLAVSETVKHEAKCNVCKDYPIVGFRYRCLKCFNFDICQECFWSGGVNKQHKISHPTQEYCLVSTQKEDIKDFTKVLRNKVSKKKKRKQEHPSKGRYIPIGIEDAVPSDADEDDSVDAPVSTKVFPGTHDKLGSYAARLADHESMEDEDESKEATPLPRPSMDDEHHLIRRYANRLSGDMDEASPYSSQLSRPVDSKEKRDLEDLITDLEDDNRALLGEIANIHDSRRHNDAERVNISDGDSAEATFLREQRERLEAREEVLEAHNHQLQVQLHRLRILLQQGDMSQISALMKSHQTSPPLTSHTTAAPPTTSLQPSRNPGTSAENSSSGVYQPTSFMGSPPSYPVGSLTPVSRHTFPAPGSATAMQAYPPQYSLPPSVLPPRRDVSWQPQSGDVRGAAPNTKIPLGSPVGVSMLPPRRDVSWQPQSGDVRGASPNTNVPLGSPVGVSGFAPKTAAELGLLDRPDSSFEEMEMSSIVDRMTAAFPLDVHSDMPVDVHNDLFLAAGLIGESLQSMVTTVSRGTGPRKGAVESRRSYERDLDEPRYGQDNLGYGDWPRTDPEGANRFSTHSSTGSEYGPL